MRRSTQNTENLPEQLNLIGPEDTAETSSSSLFNYRTLVSQHSASYGKQSTYQHSNITPKSKAQLSARHDTNAYIPRKICKLTQKQVRSFWSKVDKSGEGGCWTWKGSTTGRRHCRIRYGTWKVNNQNMRPHRVAYTLCVGEIPDGLTLDHSCENKLCVNPAHLTPMSLLENVAKRAGSPVPYAYRQHDAHHKGSTL